MKTTDRRWHSAAAAALAYGAAAALALALGFALCLGLAAPRKALAAVLPEGDDEAIAKTVEAYVAEHEGTTAGLAVSVFDEGGERYTGYFGHANEAGDAVDGETVFEWGSATKLLVWVSAMQLAEAGELDLDADIATYLPPDFMDAISLRYPVTMRDLMNHEAGFQEMLLDLFARGDSYPRDLKDALLAHVPVQIFEPGAVCAYSNWGCALAGYVVECVSGQSFADYAHEHVFEPLGMRHTALLPDLSDNAWVAERRANLDCYNASGALMPGCFYHIALYPAGMCTSTLDDFRTFAEALLAEDSPLFATRAGTADLFGPTSYEGESGIARNRHGLWELQYATPLVGHGGNTAGCSSYLLLDLTGRTGIVIMTNQSNEEVYNEGLVQELYGAFSEEGLLPGRALPGGMWRTARTVREGPLKLDSAGYILVDDEWHDEFWVHDASGKPERVSMPYTDLVKVTLPELVLELGLLALWAAGLAFSVVYLLCAGIAALVRRLRKTEAADEARGLRVWAALLQLADAAFLTAGVYVLVSYRPSWLFQGALVLLCANALLMVVCAVHFLGRGRLHGHLNRASFAFLLAALANIAYWNLYQFWAV